MTTLENEYDMSMAKRVLMPLKMTDMGAFYEFHYRTERKMKTAFKVAHKIGLDPYAAGRLVSSGNYVFHILK